MSIVDKIRGCNGTTKYMYKFNIGKPKKKSHIAVDEYLNNIILKFGKENDIKYIKNNRRGYKGSFNPLIENGWNVQDHFPLFMKWMNTNYKKINS